MTYTATVDNKEVTISDADLDSRQAGSLSRILRDQRNDGVVICESEIAAQYLRESVDVREAS